MYGGSLRFLYGEGNPIEPVYITLQDTGQPTDETGHVFEAHLVGASYCDGGARHAERLRRKVQRQQQRPYRFPHAFRDAMDLAGRVCGGNRVDADGVR